MAFIITLACAVGADSTVVAAQATLRIRGRIMGILFGSTAGAPAVDSLRHYGVGASKFTVYFTRPVASPAVMSPMRSKDAAW